MTNRTITYTLMVMVDSKLVFSDTYEDSASLQEALDAADEAVEQELNSEPEERIFDNEA